MKKSDLESGMIVQTTHNRYGIVELDKNRIVICYDPNVIKDEYAYLGNISLDSVFELEDGKLGVGFILSEDGKKKFPNVYSENNAGDLIICYNIVAVYTTKAIYYDGVGSYPPLIVND